MSIRRILLTSLFAVPISAGFLYAQPTPAPTSGDKLCSVDTSAIWQVDTVVSVQDSNGFQSIFDGKTWTGWWQNCLSGHSSGNRTLGAIWRIDTTRKAIYAMTRHNSSPNPGFNADGSLAASGGTNVSQNGGLLATHKRYGHYELIFDWWPEYGNDGGVFNRFTILPSGGGVAANQMVLDYMHQSGVLSYYSENGWPGGRNGRPWTYNQSITAFTASSADPVGDTALSIPGFGGGGNDGVGALSHWTKQTAKLNPTAYGCAASGCIAADYKRLWPRHGWVQVRQRYYGGLSTSQGVSNFTTAENLIGNTNDKIHEETFFRRYYPVDTSIQSWDPVLMNTYVAGVSDTAQWVPVLKDSCALTASQVPTYSKIAPFAFQVHGGDRYRKAGAAYQGGKGSWYRNIRVRELDSLGMPKYITSVNPASAKKVRYDLHVKSGFLTGNMDLDHVVFVRNVKGEILQRISGIAGRDVRYEMPVTTGMYLVQVSTSRGTQNFRIINRGTGR